MEANKKCVEAVLRTARVASMILDIDHRLEQHHPSKGWTSLLPTFLRPSHKEERAHLRKMRLDLLADERKDLIHAYSACGGDVSTPSKNRGRDIGEESYYSMVSRPEHLRYPSPFKHTGRKVEDE